MTPDVAKEVHAAGISLMKMRLLKVADLGDEFCKLAKLLRQDKELAQDLLQMLIDLKKKTDNIWNSSSFVKELIGRQ